MCEGKAPGINGIQFKLLKNCPRVLKILTTLLQRVWRHKIVPQKWCLVDGIWIRKVMNAEGIKDFRPISLLNLERKILFGIVTCCMYVVLSISFQTFLYTHLKLSQTLENSVCYCYTSYEMTDQFLGFQLQINSYSSNWNTPY